MAETSTKPYLIRAIHEWCTDNGYRPYLAVAVDEHTLVPREFVRGGEIVLNVSIDATNRLQLRNDLIEFEARFGGVARQVSIPVGAVTAIYAAENGQGMSFEVFQDGTAEEADASPEASEEAASAAPPPVERGPVLVQAPARAAVSPVDEGDADGPAPDEPAPPAGGGRRPRLTRIK